jgi:hypothetical protein
VEVFARWAVLLGIVVGCAVPGLAGESADEPKPPPLPAIELPPSPAQPEGVPLAIEAGRRIGEGDYQGALPLYLEAWDKGVKSQNSTYNAACAAAVTGHPDEAFVWLTRAADAGWRDADHLETDTDLDSLRDDPRFAAFVKTVEANAKRYDSENNAELRMLVEADQAARHQDMSAISEEERRALWEKISADDAARRARVAEIIAAGGAKTGEDYFAAALVYQHGDRLDDYARAREYAAKAVELGDESGRWLAAAAWDRWLVKAGYPQRFGTQYACNPDCKLQEWDESTTDEMRARWNVPPLETAKKMMDRR